MYIDLLKYEKDNPTKKFLDSLSLNMVLLYILHPTRIHGQSRTLIDNIFSKQYNKEAVSGNLTSVISDHFPHLLFVPSIFSDPNISQRNWFKFNKEGFILDYFKKDCDSVLSISRNDVDFSFNNFIDEHE